MLQAIGVMIGFYILTRMTAMLAAPTDRFGNGTKFMAAVTVLVTLLCLAALVLTGADLAALRQR